MGAEAGEVAEKGRSPNQESRHSQADEPSDEEENVGFDEGALGGKEEGWRSILIEP
jgi:hypothetical protein